MNNKYKVGDIVDFCGNKAKIIDVYEHFYFYGGSDPYYEYTVELLNSLDRHKVVESILSPWKECDKIANSCECGAWAVHWAPDQHSRWCRLYRRVGD